MRTNTLNTFPNAKHRCQADIIAAAEYAINVHNMKQKIFMKKIYAPLFYVKQ